MFWAFGTQKSHMELDTETLRGKINVPKASIQIDFKVGFMELKNFCQFWKGVDFYVDLCGFLAGFSQIKI